MTYKSKHGEVGKVMDDKMMRDALLFESRGESDLAKQMARRLRNQARLEHSEMEQETYGSGTATVVPGFDHVSIPECNLAGPDVGVKEILDHQIPFLSLTAKLTAIVGLGP